VRKVKVYALFYSHESHGDTGNTESLEGIYQEAEGAKEGAGQMIEEYGYPPLIWINSESHYGNDGHYFRIVPYEVQ